MLEIKFSRNRSKVDRNFIPIKPLPNYKQEVASFNRDTGYCAIVFSLHKRRGSKKVSYAKLSNDARDAIKPESAH